MLQSIPFILNNKNVLVTGASSGIGRAIAIECSKMGANVIITGRNKERLNETALLLEGKNNQQIIADMNNEEDVMSLISFLPQLDGLVLNAGVNKRQLSQYIKKEDLALIMNTNLISPVLFMKSVVKEKKLRSLSSVVFISSIAAYHSSLGDGAYSATKGGISSFAKVLALELASRGIRVNTIQPGMVRTSLIENGPLSDDDYLKDEVRYPLGRYGKPEEIAYAAIYLLSDASVWMTGSDLKIDGGISLL